MHLALQGDEGSSSILYRLYSIPYSILYHKLQHTLFSNLSEPVDQSFVSGGLASLRQFNLRSKLGFLISFAEFRPTRFRISLDFRSHICSVTNELLTVAGWLFVSAIFRWLVPMIDHPMEEPELDFRTNRPEQLKTATTAPWHTGCSVQLSICCGSCSSSPRRSELNGGLVHVRCNPYVAPRRNQKWPKYIIVHSTYIIYYITYKSEGVPIFDPLGR